MFILTDNTLTTLVDYPWQEDLTELDLGTNQIISLEGLPAKLTWLILGTNRIETLDGLPQSLRRLDLGKNQIISLEGLPQSLEYLYLGVNKIVSLEGLPQSLIWLDLGKNQIVSLEGLPQSLINLWLGTNRIVSLEGLPAGLTHLWLGENQIATEQLLALAYCSVLQHIHSFVNGPDQELKRALHVPLNKRPARVVLVVLSSSSVPRVGMKAAVRRLHRADLVREMAEMLA